MPKPKPTLKSDIIVKTEIRDSNDKPVKPHMSSRDIEIFELYLKGSRIYFEFGSGYSTIFAAQFNSIQKIFTVENDVRWAKLVKSFKIPKIKIIYVDTNSDNSRLGRPKTKDFDKISNYFTTYHKKYKADLMLIDGRFRVNCALDILSKISNSTYVLFDDFNNRPEYYVILNYYKVVERGDKLVVLNKRTDINLAKLEKDMIKYRKKSDYR